MSSSPRTPTEISKIIGLIDDIHEAANAYDVAAVKYFGSFAYTNKDMR